MGAPLPQDLSRIGNARIFFAHQSVGHNVLTYLRDLWGGNVPVCDILKVEPGDGLPVGPCLAHATLGENSNPVSKIGAFGIFLDRDPAAQWDVVLMKLCYLDVTSDTDVQGLFEVYRDGARVLQKNHPDWTLVHATVPLTREAPLKALLKKTLGKPTAQDHNVKRQEYNELLLREFGSEPVFDIARIESTHADGSRASFRKRGRTYFSLADEYTEDGGHLNAVGGGVLAREFVRVLAGALEGKNQNG